MFLSNLILLFNGFYATGNYFPIVSQMIACRI